MAALIHIDWSTDLRSAPAVQALFDVVRARRGPCRPTRIPTRRGHDGGRRRHHPGRTRRSITVSRASAGAGRRVEPDSRGRTRRRQRRWSTGPTASASTRPARHEIVEAARRDELVAAELRRWRMSWNIRSQPAMSPASRPVSAASHSTKSPSVTCPSPQTGVRCCCLSRPAGRSRHGQVDGQLGDASGRSISTSAVSPPVVTTRPDKPSSRSSHEFTKAPP